MNAADLSDKSRKRDRQVKIGFLVVAAILVLLVYWWQRKPTLLPGTWLTDVPKAMEQARNEKRSVLLFFTHSAWGEAEKRIAFFGFSKNVKALNKFDYILVKVSPSLDSDLARQYKVTKLPTLLILDPNGREKNRRELLVDVGETEFPLFLDLSQPYKAPTTNPKDDVY